MYLLLSGTWSSALSAVVDGADHLARFMAHRSAHRATAGALVSVVVIDVAPARFDLLRCTTAPASSRRLSSANRKAVAEGSAIIITCWRDILDSWCSSALATSLGHARGIRLRGMYPRPNAGGVGQSRLFV